MNPETIDFRSVFESSPNSYMVLDRELRYVAANAAYLRVTASRLEDLLGRRVTDAFPHDPDDPLNESARQLRASFDRVLASRAPDTLALIAYRVPRYEDDRVVVEERYWSATHTPILDDRGEVAFILQHTVDITELQHLKRAAAAAAPAREGQPSPEQVEAGVLGRAQRVQEVNRSLDAERQHLRRMFEQAPGFMCFLRGPEHVYELANQAYYQLVGHRDLTGKAVRAVLPEVEGQGYFELLDRAFASGEPFVGRGMKIFLQQEPEGPLREVYLDLVFQPIIEPSGAVSGIFVQGNDISEQKRLEGEREALLQREQAARAEAERANGLKDDFLAMVSHELRTPLNAILGWVQLLRGGQVPAEKQARVLETVERNARAQSQVIDDLLDVSRIASGKLQLQMAPVQVSAVVEAALEIFRPAAEAKGIVLREALDPEARALGDEGRLHQVVWQLLSNAVKFTPAGGRVEVAVQRREGGVEVIVADTGKGIPPDFLPHLFDHFRQAEGGTTRHHGGLGLGLAIVKQLVDLHGGAIAAESEGEGRGARFTITLPVLAAPRSSDDARAARVSPIPAAPSAPEAQQEAPWTCPPELAGMRLLVVDDEPDGREMVRSLLERCGARVETAGSAAEGFEAVRRTRPDLLLFDVSMPGEDGYSLMRRVRALPPEEGGRIPAVALTAHARSADRTRALFAGFKAHVPKPIEPAELMAVLVSVIQAQER